MPRSLKAISTRGVRLATSTGCTAADCRLSPWWKEGLTLGAQGRRQRGPKEAQCGMECSPVVRTCQRRALPGWTLPNRPKQLPMSKATDALLPTAMRRKLATRRYSRLRGFSRFNSAPVGWTRQCEYVRHTRGARGGTCGMPNRPSYSETYQNHATMNRKSVKLKIQKVKPTHNHRIFQNLRRARRQRMPDWQNAAAYPERTGAYRLSTTPWRLAR